MKIGELIADRYTLEELVGAGGMSSVYRAWDRVLERPVALKVLHEHYSNDDEHVERFRREARAIAQLSHPHIVTVIDRGEWDGRQYIVFEHVAGENLKELVVREGPLPERRALALALQAGRGLAFAHEHGVVHRDVKPHNVLVDKEGTAKVTDFGIARALDPEYALTETGAVLGTSDYIAPEQVQGEAVDERSDQYSLGVLLYELLTGQPPYRGEGPMAVALSHVNEPVPDVRRARADVSPRLAALIERAMAKRREDRFPSTQAMLEELEACLADERDGDEAGATAALAPPEPGVLARRRRARLVVPLLALLAAAVAVGILLARGGDAGGDAASGERIELRSVADYDPAGDGGEHPEDVPAATDGDPATYWTTETYESFSKPGVGIVVDAREPRELAALVLRTDTPGFVARVQAGEAPSGPFRDVSESQTVSGRTTFQLDTGGEEFRYYVVWITDLKGRAHVNELAAR